MKQEINLYDYQIIHKKNIIEKFKNNKVLFDMSRMGSGKSIVIGDLSKNYKKVIVITYPNIIKQSWAITREKYELDIEFISINVLRGMKSSELNHNYLSRESTYKKNKFTCTSVWKDLCKGGLLLVIDEVQMIKNKNIGYLAVLALIKEIIATDGDSRCILMSGTPADNKEQINNYKELSGVNDLETISIKMEPSEHKYKINGYYLYKSISPSGAPVQDGDIKTYLNKLELFKASLFCDEAKKIYYTNPNAKIIIGLFFIDAINRCASILKNLNPKIIIGDTKDSERTEIMREFNAPNSNTRILIANTTIISTGINLDDEDGRFPRHFIISPNHMIMVIHQLQYRILRANTKSDGEIKIIMCKDIDEREIIESMYEKSETMSIYTKGTIFPSNFDSIYE